jgi:hypothetical protein
MSSRRFDPHQTALPAHLGRSHPWIQPVQTRTQQLFILRCRTCGQMGHLWLSENGQRDWSFTTVGFIGLAVNRHNPPNSVLRCNGCSSPQVAVTLAPPQPG